MCFIKSDRICGAGAGPKLSCVCSVATSGQATPYQKPSPAVATASAIFLLVPVNLGKPVVGSPRTMVRRRCSGRAPNDGVWWGGSCLFSSS